MFNTVCIALAAVVCCTLIIVEVDRIHMAAPISDTRTPGQTWSDVTPANRGK